MFSPKKGWETPTEPRSIVAVTLVLISIIIIIFNKLT